MLELSRETLIGIDNDRMTLIHCLMGVENYPQRLLAYVGNPEVTTEWPSDAELSSWEAIILREFAKPEFKQALLHLTRTIDEVAEAEYDAKLVADATAKVEAEHPDWPDYLRDAERDLYIANWRMDRINDKVGRLAWLPNSEQEAFKKAEVAVRVALEVSKSAVNRYFKEAAEPDPAPAESDTGN